MIVLGIAGPAACAVTGCTFIARSLSIGGLVLGVAALAVLWHDRRGGGGGG